MIVLLLPPTSSSPSPSSSPSSSPSLQRAIGNVSPVLLTWSPSLNWRLRNESFKKQTLCQPWPHCQWLVLILIKGTVRLSVPGGLVTSPAMWRGYARCFFLFLQGFSHANCRLMKPHPFLHLLSKRILLCVRYQ